MDELGTVAGEGRGCGFAVHRLLVTGEARRGTGSDAGRTRGRWPSSGIYFGRLPAIFVCLPLPLHLSSASLSSALCWDYPEV